MIEINTQCIPVKELLKLVTPELGKVIKDCEAKVKAKNKILYIHGDMTNTKFDVELEEDFDSNLFMWFEPSELNTDIDHDGWFEEELNKAYANLLEGWNWDAMRTIDGRTVIITEDEMFDGDITINFVDPDNIVDGAIESKHWLGISVVPTT